MWSSNREPPDRDGLEIFTSCLFEETNREEGDEAFEWLRKHVEPVLVTAAQWFPRRALEGWERLWLGVLIDAILEYAATFMKRPPRFRDMPRALRARRRAAVLAWFNGAEAALSFTDICEQFEIRESRIWGVLRAIEEAGLRIA